MVSPLILVVEDDLDTRRLYRLVYEASHCRVVEARSVAEALDSASHLRPDVIVTDWLLGDGDGFALCAGLRRRGRTRRIPVIAATGVSLLPHAIARARELGCGAVLTKPVPLDTLVHGTASALQIAQTRVLRAATVRFQRDAARVRRDIPGTDLRGSVSRLLSAARLRARSRVALVIADDEGRYVAANDEAAELTGYEPKVLTTRSVEDLTPASHAADRQELWTSYIVRRRDGESIPMRYVAVANITPGLHLSALSAIRHVPRPLTDIIGDNLAS
jgi:PAS domain S-box-containing protein